MYNEKIKKLACSIIIIAIALTGFFVVSFLMHHYLGITTTSSGSKIIASFVDNKDEKFVSVVPLKNTRWDLYGRVWKIDKTTGEITLIHFIPPNKLPGKITQEAHFLIIQIAERKILFVHTKKEANGNIVYEKGSLNDIKDGEHGSFIHRIIYRNMAIDEDPLIEFRYSEDSPFNITNGLTTSITL